MTVAVYLGGEGRNELGSRDGAPEYQTDDEPGVVHALLTRARRDGWFVAGATAWTRIRKLRAHGPSPNEARNVLGLVHEASRANARVVAFVRDADGDARREPALRDGVEQARGAFPKIDVVWGVATPVLEGWILAFDGLPRTEELTKAQALSLLQQRGHTAKSTFAMTEIIRRADADTVDNARLNDWIATARRVLDQAGESTGHVARSER